VRRTLLQWRFISLAAQRSQVWIVTHSRDLAAAIERTDGTQPMTVVKQRGATGIHGLRLDGEID